MIENMESNIGGTLVASTCYFPEVVVYELIGSKIGYSQNLMDYIVGARRTIKHG